MSPPSGPLPRPKGLAPAALRQLCDFLGSPPIDAAAAWEHVGLAAAAWERATASQRERLRTAALGLQGLVQRRRCRATGVEASIYDATADAFDPGGGTDECPARYAVVCEAHSTLVTVHSLRAARSTSSDTRNFCDDCREASPQEEALHG